MKKVTNFFLQFFIFIIKVVLKLFKNGRLTDTLRTSVNWTLFNIDFEHPSPPPSQKIFLKKKIQKKRKPKKVLLFFICIFLFLVLKKKL